MPLGLRASDHVRWAVVEGGVIVLDLKRADYLCLDEIASLFWQSALRPITAAPMTGADLPAACADGENARFLDDCQHLGLLTTAPASPVSQSRPARWADRVALAALVGTSRRLRRQGLGQCLTHCAALRPGRRGPALASLLQRFASAENFHLSSRAPQDCLPRSLALYRYLVGHGQPAVHVIGVRRVPFLAHAWVEVDGRSVLGPPPDHLVALSRITAGA